MLEVKLLERHTHTNQIFIPMGNGALKGYEDDSLPKVARAYLVAVAQNGAGKSLFVSRTSMYRCSSLLGRRQTRPIHSSCLRG